MKPIKFLRLGCLCILLTASQCRKDKGSLPPETQTGANTFGCLIDGKVWEPKGSDGYSGTNKKANYQYIYPTESGFVFQISAANYDDKPLTAVGIGVDSIKITEGKVYKFRNGYKGEFGASYRIGNNGAETYWVRDSQVGEIVFKKFDEANQIASGTFWFDAMNASGKLIHVTEGRFDMKYTR